MNKDLFKMIREATETETEPTTEPTTTPETPSAPSKRPRSPIRPEPGQAPKPKANSDLELFLAKRGLITEAKVNEMNSEALRKAKELYHAGHSLDTISDKLNAEFFLEEGDVMEIINTLKAEKRARMGESKTQDVKDYANKLMDSGVEEPEAIKKTAVKFGMTPKWVWDILNEAWESSGEPKRIWKDTICPECGKTETSFYTEKGFHPARSMEVKCKKCGKTTQHSIKSVGPTPKPSIFNPLFQKPTESKVNESLRAWEWGAYKNKSEKSTAQYNGLARGIVVAPSKSEATTMIRVKYPDQSIKLLLDDENTPEYYKVPEKVGMYKHGWDAKESKVNEFAFDAGNKADLVHQDKRTWIENPDEQLRQILPELSDSEQTYAELITSQTYQDMISQIEKYTGLRVTNRSVPTLYGLLMDSLRTVAQIESSNKRQLEELALTAVFEVPEFKLVEDAYLGNEVKFDIKLGPAELEAVIEPANDEVEEDGELSEDEELNMALANDFDEIMDIAVKRRFANLMITGGAVQNLFIFHMVEEQLARIDARLPKLYGILGSLAMLGYWVTPEGVEQGAARSSAGGSEEISFGETDVIKARGIAFPFLAYELTKGIYEWLSYSKDQESAIDKVDGLEKETPDMLAGPGIYKTITSYISADETEMLPLVKRKLLKLSAEDIKNVLAKNEEGQRIMQDIIAQSRQEWEAYNKEMEAYKGEAQ